MRRRGTEWIELTYSETVKEVRFEHSESIKGIHGAIVKLRALVAELDPDQ